LVAIVRLASMDALTGLAPFPTVRAPTGMVCAVDHLASSAGVAMLRAGGSAADAAVAASAVLAVTFQHACGMGGDLLALVHTAGAHLAGAADDTGVSRPGDLVRRPGVARTLAGIGAGGRAAFYQGEFGDGLVRLGHGEFTAADMARVQAGWVDAISVDAFGHT